MKCDLMYLSNYWKKDCKKYMDCILVTKPPISSVVQISHSDYAHTCPDKAQTWTLPLHSLDPGTLELHHPAGAQVK